MFLSNLTQEQTELAFQILDRMDSQSVIPNPIQHLTQSEWTLLAEYLELIY